MKQSRDNKNNPALQGVALLTAAALVFVAVFAWYTMSGTTRGGGIQLAAKQDDSAQLSVYHITEFNDDGTVKTEERADGIVIENYVPNQKESYRIAISNPSTSHKVLRLDFENINADFTPKSPEAAANMELAKVIKLCSLNAENLNGDIILNSGAASNEGTNLFDLYGGESAVKTDINLVSNIKLESGGTGNIYLSFYLDKDNADNSYQQMAIQIEKIILSGGAQ